MIYKQFRTFFLLIALFIYFPYYAGASNVGASITLKIDSIAKGDVAKLEIFDNVFGAGESGFSDERTVISNDSSMDLFYGIPSSGGINFTLSDLKAPKYAVLINTSNLFGKKRNIDFSFSIWPGDSIIITRRDNQYIFSGKGAEKYNCLALITNINRQAGYPDKPENIVKWCLKLDSLALVCKRILMTYEDKIPANVYKIMLSNIVCDFELKKYYYLKYQVGLVGDPNLSTLQRRFKGYKSPIWNKEVFNLFIGDSTIIHSLRFLLFVVDQYKTEGMLLGKDYSTNDCFDYICSKFDNSIRQTLIYFLFHSDVYQFKDKLSKCIKFALDSGFIYDSSLRTYFNVFVINNTEYAKAFPFNFKDRYGRSYSLDDFRNKVVLLDFWYIGCGPCVGMHNVLDSFKRRSTDLSFEIVSICLSGASDDVGQWTKALSSGAYTSNDNINLFAARQNGKTNDIFNYYSLVGCPSLILINKIGETTTAFDDPRVDKGVSLKDKIKSLQQQ